MLRLHAGLWSALGPTGSGLALLGCVNCNRLKQRVSRSTAPHEFDWDGPYSVTRSPEVGHQPSITMVACEISACTGLSFNSDVIQVHQGGQDSGRSCGIAQASIPG